MTRGKHAARRAARDQRAAASLADHVQRARDRLEEAQQCQLAVRDLEQHLHQETAVLQDQSREREAQLRATAGALTIKVGDLEQAVDDLDDAWRKLSRKVIGRLGSWHALSSLLNGTPTLATSSLDGVHADAPAAVLRAHARRHLPPNYTGTVSPLTWFADWLPEPAHIVGRQLRHTDPLTVRGVHHEVDLPEHLATSVTRVGPLIDAVAASTIDTLDPYCLAAWQPLPWLASGTYTPGTARDRTRQPSTMQTALGALDRLDPDDWPTRQEPSGAVRKRGREWLAEQRHIRARGRLATPWAPRPIFFRPIDAEALRCWYRRDALCDWASASTLAATLRDLHDQNPDLGEPDELRGEIALAQRLTEELDQAALYWLPPGHTAAHAAQRALERRRPPRVAVAVPLGPAHLRRSARPAPRERRGNRRHLPRQARPRPAVRTRAQPSADVARLDREHRLHAR